MGSCEGRVGQSTVSFLMLLVFLHSFESCGTSEDLVGEATLIVRLGPVLSVDILVSLRGVV